MKRKPAAKNKTRTTGAINSLPPGKAVSRPANPGSIVASLTRQSAGGKKALLSEVRELILAARQSVAQTVNSTLTLLYWEIGRRIRQDVLQSKRAGYGDQIVSALGRQLEREFGRGFGHRNLFRMIRFAEVFPDLKIVSALRTQLGWTHFRQIIPIADPLKRDFYAEMCRIEKWSTRTLEKKIGGMLFERTALSRKPAKLAEMELKKTARGRQADARPGVP